LEKFKNITPEAFKLIVILVIFLIYIKNTTVILALVPIILLILNFKLLSKHLLKSFLIVSLIFALFIVKNMIVCGTPLFPSKIFNAFKIDYAIPDSIESFYYNEVKAYGYFINVEQYNSISAVDLFIKWVSLPKLNGIFNKISLLLIVSVPFLIYKKQNKKSCWILYLLMILQMLLLFATSPQYRFFMNFVLFFSIFCLVCFVENKTVIHTLLLLSLIPTIIVLFIPLNLNVFANHDSMKKTSNFSIENLVYPYKNTKNNSTFVTVQLENFYYNSPVSNNFFWGNGDGNLPCVNKKQIEYFEKHFQTIPQMRTNNLKDGFYAKKIQKNE
jgi:hypothetical protein